MTMAASQIHGADLSDLPGILSKEDQRRAFGIAKRHTLAARILKFLMPLASLAIIVLYFVPNGKVSLTPDVPVTIDSIGLSSKGLKMINPRYAGGNDKLGWYKVEAEYALQQLSNTHLLEMHKITGQIDQADNKWTKLIATKGTYNTKSELMDLEGDILISSNQGMEARMRSAKINMKKQIITTDKPVEMRLNKNVINADAMVLNTAQKRVLFQGRVKVKLLRNKPMTK